MNMVATMLAAVAMLALVSVVGWQASHGFESFKIKHKRIPSADALGGGVRGKARQTQTVITGLVIVITASLAVIVVDQFDQSLGTPQSSQLSTAQNDVLSGFGDMVSLIGPLLLVLIAVVIVGVVQRLRG